MLKVWPPALVKAGSVDGHGLHVATDADIGDRVAVRAAGNDLAVGDAVDALDHVARRAVMHAEADSARPSRLAQLVFRDVVGRRTVAAVMALSCTRRRARRW